jgi:3-oxoacyl-[acyl-carrier protein] reductase
VFSKRREEIMSGRLSGNAVLVTGASAGIGWACAIALAREGANLVVTARRGERLTALVRELEGAGARAVAIVGDAREEATAIAAVAAAQAQFGRLDILINNAGVGIYKNIVDTTADEYDHLIDSNVRSTFLFTRHATPIMIAQNRGTILMVSSMAGKYGFAGEAVYCATKFAQIGLAQALDKELRPHGIKVGAICPGGVKTEFALGTGRTEAGVAASTMLEPDDVARAVVLACTQPPGARIIEIQMRTMSESLT